MNCMTPVQETRIPVPADKSPCSPRIKSLFRRIEIPVQPDREFTSSALDLLHESMPAGAETIQNPENSLLFSLFSRFAGRADPAPADLSPLPRAENPPQLHPRIYALGRIGSNVKLPT
jgi:hypothetical protein